MSENEENQIEDPTEDEVERKLNALWQNLTSRRACEQKHTPEYIKKKDKKEKN